MSKYTGLTFPFPNKVQRCFFWLNKHICPVNSEQSLTVTCKSSEGSWRSQQKANACLNLSVVQVSIEVNGKWSKYSEDGNVMQLGIILLTARSRQESSQTEICHYNIPLQWIYTTTRPIEFVGPLSDVNIVYMVNKEASSYLDMRWDMR